MTRDQQVAEYQALLLENWDESTLARSVELLRSFAAFRDAHDQPLQFGIGEALVGVDEASPELARDLVVGLVAVQRSDDPLLRDTLSLVANHAVDALDAGEPAALANALAFVAKFLFDEDPARRYSLEGEIHAACGRPRAALAAWRAALETTEPDAHDYLTRVQTLWFAYLDQGRREEAEALIMALPADQRERFHAEIAEGRARGVA